MGLGCGLILIAVTDFITKNKMYKILSGVLGISLVLVPLFNGWPKLIKVPSLDGLSQARAEQLLIDNKLLPDGKRQYSTTVNDGVVIPGTQNPKADTEVKKDTLVSFAISINQGNQPSQQQVPSQPKLSINKPQNNELFCSPDTNGIYTFTVTGISTEISGSQLLLWVKPVKPSAPGNRWYLQRNPNGILKINNDGTFIGSGQVGDQQWPPHSGDTLDIAVSILSITEADNLFNQPGIVTVNYPQGNNVDIVQNLSVSFVN